MQLVTPGIGLLFWMLVSFTILLLILRKFAWKPILNMLHQREEKIEKALLAAEKAKEDMAKLKDENEQIIHEAKLERDKLVREARETKEKIISDAKKEATNEAQKIIENARLTIEQEKNAAINQIKVQAAEISVQIAEKILKKELSSENKQKDFIDGLINDIKLN